MASGELLDVAARIAEMAGPGEQVEAFVARSTATTVRAYGGEVESLTQASSAGVGVRVIVDHREGFAYAGTLDEAVVLDALAEARDNAVFGEPDEHNGLAVPDGVAPAELDLWPAGLADVPTADKVAMAIELERATTGRDPRVTSVRTAIFNDARSEGAVATSTGIRAWGRAGMCHLVVQALAVHEGETQIDAGLSVGRDFGDLDVEEAAADAVLRSTRLLGSTKPPTQRVTLVLEPRLTATILGIVGSMLNGSAVIKGRSPFAERVGEQIASPLLTFVDDPTNPLSLGADLFDGEGLACRRTSLVQDGVLQGFLHNSYTGRR
ncbi:MAG: TldD/PmbA family protein, partial [Acidimicrobiales bacterium]|nr:TldD/PmbA family protein [Acidimicrobiales bacterium]